MSKKLCEVAQIFISSIDKKIKENENNIYLCNFKDIYKNWAITLDNKDEFLKATATDLEIDKFKLNKGQVAITKDSETKHDIGVSSYIANNFDDSILGYHTALIIPNKEKLDGKYLNAYLNTNHIKKYFESNSTGSGQRYTLTLDAIKNIPIILPNIRKQKIIGNLFSLIDRKIQLNKKINDNLEKQLKLLYDYWFIQFDFPDDNGNPYKSSGGNMVWNKELKKAIPEKWSIKPLSEIIQKNSKPFDYLSIKPTIDLSVMKSDCISLTESNFSTNFTTNLFEMKKGDILFGSIRPYLHKAGFAPYDGVVAGTIHSYKVYNQYDYNFALSTLSHYSFFDYAVNVSSGTKMPVISNEAILLYKVPYSENVISKFNEIDLINVISNNIQENQKWINLRDFLLPLLMNGQVIIE